jgi:glycerol-3-phosphate dehydrogenase
LHGGLRYLQTIDLKRFRESVEQRSWFLRHFAGLVKPLGFVMPLYGQGLRRRVIMRPALALNDYLSRTRNEGVAADDQIPPGRILSRQATIQRFPEVRPQGLQGAACWFDVVMTDQERLFDAILSKACRSGANCRDRIEGIALRVEQERVMGVEAIDHRTGSRMNYCAPVVVNCGGPWCRKLAKRFDRDIPQLFQPSLAFNLLLDRKPLSQFGLAVSPPDQPNRTCFLLPRGDRTLAGTYHAAWTGPIRHPTPTDQQLEEFLDQLNRAVPSLKLAQADVLKIHAGLLPAARPASRSTATRPIVHDHCETGGPMGLYSVSGVKYTTARCVAKQTLRMIAKRQPDWQSSDEPLIRSVNPADLS